MGDVTRILNSLGDAGEGNGPGGPDEALCRLIHAELRRMAAGKMAGEPDGHTLQATALVHEAYLRLAQEGAPAWRDRRQFFAAASEAMRRILVESARRRHRVKRGGGASAVPLDEAGIELAAAPGPDDRILLVHEALERLETEDPFKAEVVKLRYFVGMTHDEVAAALGTTERTVRRHWEVAKVRLHRLIRDAESTGSPGDTDGGHGP